MWWEPKIILRANLMLQTNMKDQTSGQEFVWENFKCPPGARTLGRAPTHQTISRFRTCYTPKSNKRHQFCIRTKRYYIILKENNNHPSPPPRGSSAEPAPPGPGGPAPAAGGGAEISRAQRKQQPQTRWWAHKNIPRVNLMHRTNMQDQSSGQEIARGISGAPRREHFEPTALPNIGNIKSLSIILRSSTQIS